MGRGILIGVLLTVVVGSAAALFGVLFGLVPANADAKPGALERWAAMTALHARIDRQAPSGPDPIPADERNIVDGIRLYAEHCRVCHGGPDGKASKIARGLYQRPPQLARHGVEDDPPGETYWKIDHGIRWTGMPSFGGTLSDREIWQIVLFLRNIEQLPAGAAEVWTRVPSAAEPGE